jgi:hypothetical protein
MQAPFSTNKILMLDGYSAIRSYSFNTCHDGSLLLEENMLLIILKGTLKFRYGQALYEVSETQMAFLKKDIQVHYETGGSPDDSVTCEYIVFSLRYAIGEGIYKACRTNHCQHRRKRLLLR